MPALKVSKPKMKSELALYLGEMKEKRRVPLYKEFALRLGIHPDTLTQYETRDVYDKLLVELKQAQEVGLQRKLLDDNKPVGSIFMLKAIHGYKEASDLNVNVSGELGVVQLPQKLSK